LPKVSVIIPNYNHSSFLKQRIESVLNQTFQDFELIILDDCSSDNSKEIIDEYRNHPKVASIIYNETNSGSTFKQWQKGIDIAKGEYIWIAESDDSASPDFLDELLYRFEVNPNAVLGFVRSYNIDNEGNIIELNKYADGLDFERWNTDYENRGVDEIKNYFIYRNIIPNASAVIFKKSCFITINTHSYSHLKFAGDWLIWMTIVNMGDVVYVAKPLNYYRQHVNTTRSTKSVEREINRINEYFYVINSIKQLIQITNFDFQKHKWIIEEWVYRKKYLLKNNFWQYINPPFKGYYLQMFYKEIAKMCYNSF